jgi:hypothetical protein
MMKQARLCRHDGRGGGWPKKKTGETDRVLRALMYRSYVDRLSSVHAAVKLSCLSVVTESVGTCRNNPVIVSTDPLSWSTKYDGSNPDRATVGSSGHATGFP